MNQDIHWFVGCTMSCRERKVGDVLKLLSVDYFLPEQEVVREWSDRRKKVRRLVIPRMIFVRTTEHRRRTLLGDVPGLVRFMSRGGTFNPVIVPDSQMDVFIKMLTQSDEPVALASEPLIPGDHVRVVGGPLDGVECELVDILGNKCIALRLGSIGTATMRISLASVVKIEEN